MISGLSTMLLAPGEDPARDVRVDAPAYHPSAVELETEAVEDVLGGLAITKVFGGDLGRVRGPAEDPIEERPAAFGARQDSGDPVHPRLVALPLLVQIAGQVADDGAHGHSFGGASARRSNSGSASSSGSGRTWALMSGIERRTSRGQFMVKVERSTPSFSRKAANFRSSRLPRTITSSHSVANPAIWMFTSYWSDQNQWGSSKTSLWPSMLRAAACPIFNALSKCSTRMRPKTGWSWRATSPAAKTPGALVWRAGSTRIPLSTPTTAKSPSIALPCFVWSTSNRPSPSNRSAASRKNICTP